MQVADFAAQLVCKEKLYRGLAQRFLERTEPSAAHFPGAGLPQKAFAEWPQSPMPASNWSSCANCSGNVAAEPCSASSSAAADG